MKKLFLAFLILLTGCQKQPQYYLYVYYSQTCPMCKSFIHVVIPQLEEEYGQSMKITKMDIDEDASVEAYAKTCSLLKDYYVDEDAGSVPFIVLDGYFAKVGYDIGTDQEMIDAIHQAIAGEEISSELKDVYYFQEVKTFH